MMNNSACFIENKNYAKAIVGEKIKNSSSLKKSIVSQIKTLIDEYDVTHFILGVSVGAEQMIAEAVLEQKYINPNISLECVIAYENEAENWNEKSRNKYFNILECGDSVTMLQTQYSADSLSKKKKYLVNSSTYIVSVNAGNCTTKLMNNQYQNVG